MKKLIMAFTSVLALVSFMSCAPKLGENEFDITLKLKGIESDSAFMSVFGDREQVQLSNMKKVNEYGYITYLNDGVLNIKGTTTDAVVLRISFSDDKQLMKLANSGGYFPVKCATLWLVVSGGASFTAEGDLTGKDFVDFYPDGDAENKIFAKYSSTVMPLINTCGNYSRDNVNCLEAGETMANAEERVKEAETASEAEAAFRVKFVNENPSSIAALWLMEDMLIRSQMPVADMEPLIAKVDAKYHDNYFYKTVAGRVEGAKNSGIGARCPEVKGVDQFGEAFDMSSIKGKYILIDFWGTWCSACLKGTPHMKEFASEYPDKLALVGIAKDDNLEKWTKCIEKNGMDWVNIMNQQGNTDYVTEFNVQGFPTKILVSPEGEIVLRETGESEEFYQQIARFLR